LGVQRGKSLNTQEHLNKKRTFLKYQESTDRFFQEKTHDEKRGDHCRCQERVEVGGFHPEVLQVTDASFWTLTITREKGS